MDNKPVIGIIGTGMIASSMAVLGGGHGIKTILLARSEASVNRCKGVIKDYYDQMVEQNLITREQVDIWPVISNRTQIPDFMHELINQGKLGPKSPSQTGFYDWTNVDMKAYSDRVCKPYWALFDWVYPDKPSK